MVFSKAQFNRVPDGYFALRKTAWGGVFPALAQSTVAERARITKKSRKEIAALAMKQLPEHKVSLRDVWRKERKRAASAARSARLAPKTDSDNTSS